MTSQLFHRKFLAIILVFLGWFQQKQNGIILGIANGNCVGLAANGGGCIKEVGPENCRGFTGCEWNVVMGKCQGYPTKCEDIRDCVFCGNHGSCSWYATGEEGENPKECKTQFPTMSLVPYLKQEDSYIKEETKNPYATYNREETDDGNFTEVEVDNIAGEVDNIAGEEILAQSQNDSPEEIIPQRQRSGHIFVLEPYDIDEWDERILGSGSDTKNANCLHVIQMLAISIATTMILYIQ